MNEDSEFNPTRAVYLGTRFVHTSSKKGKKEIQYVYQEILEIENDGNALIPSPDREAYFSRKLFDGTEGVIIACSVNKTRSKFQGPYTYAGRWQNFQDRMLWRLASNQARIEKEMKVEERKKANIDSLQEYLSPIRDSLRGLDRQKRLAMIVYILDFLLE